VPAFIGRVGAELDVETARNAALVRGFVAD